MEKTSPGVISPEKRILPVNQVGSGYKQREECADEVIEPGQVFLSFALQKIGTELAEDSGNEDHPDINKLPPEKRLGLMGARIDHEHSEQPAAER